MPTPTYIPLATVTLASATDTVTFSSLPATYRDLILVVNGTISSNNEYVALRFNGDSGSNYSNVYMTGGSVVESGENTTTQILRALMGTTNGSVIWQVMDYSATDKHKTVLSRSGVTPSLSVWAAAERWANTAAINQIEIRTTAGVFNIGSTFSLYGVN